MSLSLETVQIDSPKLMEKALFVGDIWWGFATFRLKAEGKYRLDKICQMHKHGIVSSKKSILLYQKYYW